MDPNTRILGAEEAFWNADNSLPLAISHQRVSFLGMWFQHSLGQADLQAKKAFQLCITWMGELVSSAVQCSPPSPALSSPLVPGGTTHSLLGERASCAQ